jgi:hypothetical protein
MKTPRVLLIIDGSGCYFGGLLELPEGMDVAKELAEYQTKHPKKGKGTFKFRSIDFGEWLISRGASHLNYELFDTRDETYKKGVA